MTNLIYLGNFADVDTYEESSGFLWHHGKPNYDAEHADNLAGVSVGADALKIVAVQPNDHEHNGVISDDENTCDSLTYNNGSGSVTNATDSTMTGNLNVTLTDGSVVQIEAVIIQQDNGDLFVSDLRNGGTLDNLSISNIEIAHITGSCYQGWYANSSVDNTVIAPVDTSPQLDGIVEGTDAGELIDTNYTGDPEGDMIDAGDALSGPADDDVVVAGGGDDTVLAGLGDDLVYGGAGDDSIDGGVGNDVLFGDNGDGVTGTGERESFEWDQLSEHEIDGTATQDTGNVSVTYTRIKDTGHHESYESDETANVSGIDTGSETIDAHSGLKSVTNGCGNEGDFQWEFSAPVTDVAFNVNDIDGDGVVKITAYDMDGNLIPVTLTGGSHLTLLDTDTVAGADTADSNGGYDEPNTDSYNLQVNIAGPVSRIVLEHDQDGYDNSGVIVTDMYFDSGAIVGAGATGDDVIDGGDGDDIIYGDNGDSVGGGGGPAAVREVFEWDEISQTEADSSVVQNTGSVDVTYTRTQDTGGHDSKISTDELNTDGIDAGGAAVDDTSSLQSTTNGQGNVGQFQWAFSDAVEDVSFNVNDVDGGAVVTIKAFDADGNQIPVDMVAGTKVTVLDQDSFAGDDTADSNGGYDDTNNPDYNVTVTIAGPVARIELTHEQDSGQNSGINITDMYFDVVDDGGAGNTDGGDDIIDGGAGNDVLYGEGGNDTIEGGTGADEIYGGADADYIVGGTDGDVVDGGTDGDDNDTLDLSDRGPLRIVNETLDDDRDSTSGTVEFLDSTGNVIGTMEFAEIEKLILPENVGPTAVADDLEAGEDDAPAVIGNVLTNDIDPDDTDLSVSRVNGVPGNVDTPVDGSDGGTFIIDEDGNVTFDPQDDFQSLGEGEEATTTVTYTVTDPDGAESSETVTVTVTGTNDGPTATSNIYAVLPTETGGDVDGNVITDDTGDGQDSDPEGDNLTVVGVGAAVGGVGTAVAGDNGGLFTIQADGSVDFDPNGEFADVGLNETRDTSVEYTITDPSGATSTATATFTVSGSNDGTIQGTAGDDVINPTIPYVDADGDIVDAGDAKLPGDVDDDDLIYGFGGDDSIDAGNGDDEVFGGTGDDTIFGNVGDDILNGDAGEDSIRGGDGNDTIDGGADDDEINGGDGNDSIMGGSGNDDLNGNEGDDTIDGGEGDDLIRGQTGDDSLDGGVGDDSISGGQGNDVIAGGDGNDVIDAGNHIDPALDQPFPFLPSDPDTQNDIDTVFGGAGDDTINTGDDADSIDGGIGNDIIDSGIDDDVIDGGDGNDIITAGEGDDSIDGGDGDDLIYGGLDNDTLDLVDVDANGNPLDPVTDNNMDTIDGGAGNDTIYGRDDADSILGGTGDDLIYGGVDDDNIAGGAGNDTLYGDQGNDTIRGNGDDDLIYGGTGDDTINGAGGRDTLYGDDGDDRIITDPGTNTPPDQDYPGDGLAADADPLNNMDTVFGGAGNDYIQTGDDADVIFGGAGDDDINGGIDNDTITGGEGADKLVGGLGSDLFIGGTTGDVVVGGEDPDDSEIDVLDLTGTDLDRIEYATLPDGTVDPEAGTVFFNDGTTMTFSEIENVIPCFTPGTTIATARGERLVEELCEGDRIITRDNGIQEIAWVGQKTMSGTTLEQNPHLKPILIKAGALGNGLPERDMVVSPNHRILVASDKTQLYFEETEVLAAAKHMTGADGISAIDTIRTTYIHFMFERHEVVLSNGTWTESFQPGDYSLKGIGNSQRNEIFELFPELRNKAGREDYQSARTALKKHETRLLMK